MWKQRILGMVNASSVFVLNDVIYESSCEPYNTCNDNNYSFKSYLIRWLAATAKLAPFVHDQIMPILQGTAKAAAAQCTGGNSGTMCGMKWTDGKWDGTQGVGQQMGVLQAVTAPLIDSCPSIDNNKVSPSSPPSGGNPDSTGLVQPSSTSESPLSMASAAPVVTGVALPCSTCSGGSMVISAPSSALFSIQNLATASGIAVAQSAAAQAVESASAVVVPNTTSVLAFNVTLATASVPIASITQSIPPPDAPPGPAITNASIPSAPMPDTFTSSTIIVGGSQVVEVAAETPTGSAGAEETGSTYANGQAASPESVFTGAAIRASALSAGVGWMSKLAFFCGVFIFNFNS